MRWDADDNMVKMSLYVMGYTDDVLKEMFGEDTKIRLRPSYFPFTEPSAEMDISCNLCGAYSFSCLSRLNGREHF